MRRRATDGAPPSSIASRSTDLETTTERAEKIVRAALSRRSFPADAPIASTSIRTSPDGGDGGGAAGRAGGTGDVTARRVAGAGDTTGGRAEGAGAAMGGRAVGAGATTGGRADCWGEVAGARGDDPCGATTVREAGATDAGGRPELTGRDAGDPERSVVTGARK